MRACVISMISGLNLAFLGNTVHKRHGNILMKSDRSDCCHASFRTWQFIISVTLVFYCATHLSVRHKPVLGLYLNDRTNRYKEILVSPKIRVLFSGIFCPKLRKISPRQVDGVVNKTRRRRRRRWRRRSSMLTTPIQLLTSRQFPYYSNL